MVGSGRWPASRGDFAVRVMVCHWSRTRPVLSRSGQSPLGAWTGSRGAVAMKRARPSEWKKPPSAKKRVLDRRALARRPDEGLQRVVGAVVDVGIGADVEVAPALVLESREARMLAEDVGGALPGEGLAMTQAARDLGDDPPVLARLAGRRQERTLARDAAFGVGDGAVLLRPGERGQADAAGIDGVAGARSPRRRWRARRRRALRARRRRWAGWRRDWSP